MMQRDPINAHKIRALVTEIESNLQELSIFATMTSEEFKRDKHNYGLAEHHLRRALEGVLTIGTHILSRLPVKTKDYQEIILSLGAQGIVPKEFAERNRKLAGYRNRLVHMYFEVGTDELYEVVKTHLPDVQAFCGYYLEMLKDPSKFNLRAE